MPLEMHVLMTDGGSHLKEMLLRMLLRGNAYSKDEQFDDAMITQQNDLLINLPATWRHMLGTCSAHARHMLSACPAHAQRDTACKARHVDEGARVGDIASRIHVQLGRGGAGSLASHHGGGNWRERMSTKIE